MAKEYTPEEIGRLVKSLVEWRDEVDRAVLPELRQKIEAVAKGNVNLGDDVGKVLESIARVSVRLTDITGVDENGEAIAPAAAAGDQGQEEEWRARNWITIDDPALAYEWLAELTRWHETTYAVLVGRELPECWPWHPRAVVELLALNDQYEEAYGPEGSFTARSDFLARWMYQAKLHLTEPGGCLAECANGAHRDKIASGKADTSKLEDYATWWALNRDNPEARPGIV